jgi:hypothetical protein
MWTKVRKTLFFLAVAAAALAQIPGGKAVRTALVYERDLDSTSYEYCVMTGSGDDVLGPNRLVPLQITTAGSVVATSAFVASSAPFNFVAVGDELTVKQAGTNLGIDLLRYVVTRTDANNITVNTAWDLTAGFTFSFRRLTCGTTATSGWIPFSGFASASFVIDVSQFVATSMDYRLECRREGAVNSAVIISQVNKTATFQVEESVLNNTGYFDACRIGFKINTDDGDDLTTNAEKLTVFFAGLAR